MKKVLVTGANKGIGFEIAKQLIEKGFHVLLGARDINRGKAAADELEENVSFIQLDLSSADSIHQAIQEVKKEHSDLSLLVNNAGIGGNMEHGPTETDMLDLREAFEVNFFGTFELTRGILPLIKENEGIILNVTMEMASLAILSQGILPNSFTYNTSKTANNAMLVGFARELKDTQAQIFAVTPGPTSTDLNDHYPLGKTPAEGAKIIVEYATDGKWHHGQMLMKDGFMPW
ncbi:SDR family NAD(P)-dependent oxidoreductase [Virgibacillus ndiopensis]|uniref:SDR family NAD(P)-dependent oxidoreductase n=1 Tax=Virgibacillus ndiopensis TaxID=2004408 RepID=UPI000C076C81|nr:SDR family NAD(P)-dependent oxidoreductase [Virgibacillus ndiopensis]